MSLINNRQLSLVCGVLMCVATALVVAQEDADPASTDKPGATTQAPDHDGESTTTADADAEKNAEPAADDQTNKADDDPTAQTLDRLGQTQQQIEKDTPVIEPRQGAQAQDVPSRVGVPATKVDVDPAILGIAPGQDRPKLRREGEFIISRAGRLVRSADAATVMFAFEADDADSPEPPMIMQPCRLLESMEDIVQQRGDEVVFVVSGQVHVYRNANYLLPTTMKIRIDHDNLRQ